MKERILDYGKHIFNYVHALIKWMVCAIIAGICCGLVGTLFHFCVDMATEVASEHLWTLYLLPFAGCAIVFCYHINGVRKDEGTNLVISSIRSSDDVPANMTFLIFVGTVLTHLCAGSSGREGAALQIGGSMGSLIGRILHLDENEKRIIIMCGMSALFSALFGTPLAATIFSMEVISVGVMNYAAFLPCTLSAMIAVRIAEAFGIESMQYTVASIPQLNIPNTLWMVALAILCSIVGGLFVLSLQKAGKQLAKYIPNPYLRVMVGGCAVILLTLLVGERTYNGAGSAVILAAFSTRIVWYACLLKIVFTVVTMASGFKGGEIIPSFFIGATLGNAFGQLIGLDYSFTAAIGMICVFCCVVNCPLASVIMSIELFGSEGVLFFALACGICFIISGYYSLYASQHFVFSKEPLNYIDERDMQMGKKPKDWKKQQRKN